MMADDLIGISALGLLVQFGSVLTQNESCVWSKVGELLSLLDRPLKSLNSRRLEKVLSVNAALAPNSLDERVFIGRLKAEDFALLVQDDCQFGRDDNAGGREPHCCFTRSMNDIGVHSIDRGFHVWHGLEQLKSGLAHFECMLILRQEQYDRILGLHALNACRVIALPFVRATRDRDFGNPLGDTLRNHQQVIGPQGAVFLTTR